MTKHPRDASVAQKVRGHQTPEAIAPMTSSTAGASGLPMFSENSLASPAVTTCSFIAAFENTTPRIEDIARRFTLASFMAFAVDGLPALGGSSGDDYKGGQRFSKVD